MNVVRLKQVADISYGLGQPPPASSAGVPILRATNIHRGHITAEDMIFAALGDLPLSRAPLLKPGEVLVVRSGAYTGDSALITPEWEGSAPGYDLRVTPRSIDSRFLAYQMLSDRVLDQIEIAKNRAAQPHLNAEDLGDVEITVSSRHHEVALADYLDAETAQIDRMVHMLDRLRSSLDDRWDRVLDDEVLGRTGSTEPDLGAEFLGPFAAAVGKWPFGWTPRPLKRVLVSNQSGVWGGDPTGYQDTVVLRSTDISVDGAWTITDPATRNLSLLEAHAARLRIGDIVVVTSSGSEQHIGKAALVDDAVADLGAAFSNFTQRLTPSNEVDPKYVWYLLRSPFGREQLRWLSSTTTGLRNLSGRVLGAVMFPGPPLAEQRRLVSSLDEVRSEIDQITAKLARQIELLSERRRGLITAATTGQLDIAGVGA